MNRAYIISHNKHLYTGNVFLNDPDDILNLLEKYIMDFNKVNSIDEETYIDIMELKNMPIKDVLNEINAHDLEIINLVFNLFLVMEEDNFLFDTAYIMSSDYDAPDRCWLFSKYDDFPIVDNENKKLIIDDKEYDFIKEDTT